MSNVKQTKSYVKFNLFGGFWAIIAIIEKSRARWNERKHKKYLQKQKLLPGPQSRSERTNKCKRIGLRLQPTPLRSTGFIWIRWSSKSSSSEGTLLSRQHQAKILRQNKCWLHTVVISVKDVRFVSTSQNVDKLKVTVLMSHSSLNCLSASIPYVLHFPCCHLIQFYRCIRNENDSSHKHKLHTLDLRQIK